MAAADNFLATLKEIDKAMGRYYVSKGKLTNEYFNDDGIGLFYTHVKVNGFDEDDGAGFHDELKSARAEDVNECLLVDFDGEVDNVHNMPGLPTKNKAQYILEIIRKCVDNPQIKWTDDISNNTDEKYTDILVTMKNFEISEKHLHDTKTLYRQQCPEEFVKVFLKDEITIKYLAMGSFCDCEYVQHLADSYFRCKVAHFKQSKKRITIADWASKTEHPHFKKLHNKHKQTCVDIAAAVKGFSTRISNLLLLPSANKIDDNLEEIANRIRDVVLFVDFLKKGNCPFQVDFCISWSGKNVKSTMIDDEKNDEKNDDESDDDDDDDDIGDIKTADIGNIKTKLEKNKLKYVQAHVSVAQAENIRFRSIYQEFMGKLQQKNCQHQRFITFMDRRDINDKNEQLFMYEPPKETRQIPRNAVSALYFSNSTVCLLPNEEYKESPKWDGKDDSKEDKKKGKKEVNKGKIGVKTRCSQNDSMMTLSFHVKEEDVVKLYVFINGQYFRFMAEDLRDVLPEFFVKNDVNKAFVKGDWASHMEGVDDIKVPVRATIEQLIESIKPCLKDKKFKAFVRENCTK